MRTVDTLFAMEDITILWQYLYMNEEHFVTVDNGMAKLEIRMRENGSFHTKNLNFPALPDLEYTDMMVLPNMLGIVDQLKHTPPTEFDSFESRWDEIRTITLTTVGQNKMKFKNRGVN